ncbi:WW domain binding protein 4, partial [Coemansia aciculifera]
MSLPQKKAPWDRNNKYWCNYCRIFVHDNKTTRNLHDSGAKHKDNVQKFLRQIQKDEEARNQAEKKLNTQLKAIEAAATATYNKDIGKVQVETPPTSASVVAGKS